jgi:hypothetical protein
VAANSQGIAYSFKSEVMQGIHNLGVGVIRAVTTADTLKAALYAQNSSIGPATTAYSATGEVTGTNYTAGGQTVTNAVAPTTAGGASAYWTPSASITWSSVTIAALFDTVLLYNASQGNRAIGAYTFGAQTVLAGNFTLTMPANTPATALIQAS